MKKYSPFPAILLLASATGCAAGGGRFASTAFPGPVLEAGGAFQLDGAVRGSFHDSMSTSTASVARKRVKDASVTYEVKSVEERDTVAMRVLETAKDCGGYLSVEQSTNLIMRVPAERLDEAMRDLGGLGKVLRKSLSVREVTAEHVDLGIRIENARRLRARLEGLLKETSNVRDVLEIEKELARITQELELLEGKMRVLSQEIAFSTIRIDFEDAVRPGPIGWVFVGLYEGVKWLFVWD